MHTVPACRQAVCSEVLPYAEIAEIVNTVQGVCPDPDDDIFLSCAVSGVAEYVVTGDKRLYSIKKYTSISIISGTDFLNFFLSDHI